MGGLVHDVRFACRTALGQQNTPFDVDMSFYGVGWFNEWTGSFPPQQRRARGERGPGLQRAERRRRASQQPPRSCPPAPSGTARDQRGNPEASSRARTRATTRRTSASTSTTPWASDSNEVDGTDWGEDNQLVRQPQRRGRPVVRLRPRAEHLPRRGAVGEFPRRRGPGLRCSQHQLGELRGAVRGAQRRHSPVPVLRRRPTS